MQLVDSAYGRDYTVRVALTERDLAIVSMFMTHEDHLPKA
jgi:hypothetical protein